MDTPSPRNTIARLRSRSWEMELLLSGFVLVLLLPVPGYLERQGNIWLANLNISLVQQLLTIGYIIGLFGSRILIANLVIYLFLRGFWIGIIGLSSAFPQGIRWPRFLYREPYQTYLERKTPPTESYVETINRISSSVFSFSFLLVFLVIAFFTTLLLPIFLVVTVNTYFSDYPDAHWVSKTLRIVVPVLFGIYYSLTLLFLVDFLTFGLIKRIAWKPLIRLYFPIYRFFRWITLAPLYTPIYYTLLSNVTKRTIAFVLIAYLSLFFFFNNYSYSEEIFYPGNEGSPYQLTSRHYEDQYDEPPPRPVPLIPSEYVAHPYLRLFLPYLVGDNDSLRRHCPEVVIFREPGFTSDFEVRFDISTSSDTTQGQSSAKREENVQAALHCLTRLYQVYLNDSLYRPSAFYFYRHAPTNQAGLVTYLSLTSLPTGPHLLTVKKRDYTADVPDSYETYYIPFVKE